MVFPACVSGCVRGGCCWFPWKRDRKRESKARFSRLSRDPVNLIDSDAKSRMLGAESSNRRESGSLMSSEWWGGWWLVGVARPLLGAEKQTHTKFKL